MRIEFTQSSFAKPIIQHNLLIHHTGAVGSVYFLSLEAEREIHIYYLN